MQHETEQGRGIGELNLTEGTYQSLANLIMQKSGLIILNGPAGSGKTTTIYSILQTIASPDRKVVTVEDPVETRLPYVSHIQVNRNANFATISRAFMRQDADIIFIGEVRDEESAISAIVKNRRCHLLVRAISRPSI